MTRSRLIATGTLLALGIVFSVPSLLGCAMLMQAVITRTPVGGDSGMAAGILALISAPIALAFLCIHLMLCSDGKRKPGLWALACLFGCPLLFIAIYSLFLSMGAR